MTTLFEIRDQALGELKSEQTKTAQLAHTDKATQSLGLKDLANQSLAEARQLEANPPSVVQQQARPQKTARHPRRWR